MSEQQRCLTLDQVEVGQALPVLEVDVSATTVIVGALASRDWRPMHHDRDFAQNQGVRDVFLNTPNQALWFERYVTDWTGPRGRLGAMDFQMKTSVCPGDHMTMSGVVEEIDTDSHGCGWLRLAIQMSVEGRECTSCRMRVAIPADEGDNPWARRGEDWNP